MYEFRLFIADGVPSSTEAVRNLRRSLDEHFGDQYSLELIDVLENPQLAMDNGILATPTAMRLSPDPVRRIVGDMSNKERTLAALDIA